MNDIIQLVTVLFVLSIICERVAEFFKNFFSGKKVGKFFITGDTTTKFPVNSKQELRRHYRVLKINLVIGFFTALLCHADFFQILQNIKDPGSVLHWPDHFSVEFDISYLPSNIYFLIGCFLTGCFISLGSKFWHDMLDILVSIKDAKQAISPVTDIVSLPRDQQFGILQAAIRQNIGEWKQTIKNFEGVNISTKLKGEIPVTTGELAIQFNVTKKEDVPVGDIHSVPPFVFYDKYRIPTDVLTTGSAESATGFTGEGIGPPKPGGCSIGRNKNPLAGTLGMRVILKDNKTYGLSCYHVLFPEEMRKKIYEIKRSEAAQIVGSPQIVSPSVSDTLQTASFIGKASHGKFSEFIDVGFFETTGNDVKSEINGIGSPGDIYDLSTSDEKKLHVKFCGRTSGIVSEGIVHSVSAFPDVTYFKNTPDRITVSMQGLAQLNIEAAKGDSGSVVMTRDTNQIVGMIIAVGNGFAYIVTMRGIFNNYSFKPA